MSLPRAEPGGAPWLKARPPGALIRAPAPSQSNQNHIWLDFTLALFSQCAFISAALSQQHLNLYPELVLHLFLLHFYLLHILYQTVKESYSKSLCSSLPTADSRERTAE